MNKVLKRVNPPGVAPPLARYSHLVLVPPGMSLLVLAGQTGHARDGDLPGTVVDQYRNALANVVTILASQGLGPDSIVKLNTWFVGEVDTAAIRTIRRELLGDAQPASTAAWVSRLYLPELLVEVEAWAAAPALP